MKNKQPQPKLTLKGFFISVILGTVFFLFCIVKCSQSVAQKPVFDHNEAIMFVEMAVKKNLNDPDSYESVEQKANLLDQASHRYRVKLSYRAKNAFGAVITKTSVYEIDSTYVVIPIE